MVAVKENRCYTINDADKASFVKAGYDILDDKGNVIEYGAGKTIAYSVYIDAIKAKDAEIAKLKAEVAKLKKEPKQKG